GYDGSVKVLDFGIAKAEERATKTVGGTIKGKYGYMSPEQCKGKPIDRRSDIFALGIVLYELTTLRRAFKGNDDFETMKRIVAGDVVLPSIAVPGYPRELEAIVLTAMANDTAARFQTAQELIEALDAFAVRAKLTGSNTAMGRFMTQLFGAKREPWVNHHPQHDKTEPDNGLDADTDNDKTQLVENHQMPVEALRPEQQYPAPRKSPNPPGSRTMPMPSPRAPSEADAAAWQATDSSHQQRQNARAQAPRSQYSSGTNPAHPRSHTPPQHGAPHQQENKVATLPGTGQHPQHPGLYDDVSDVGATQTNVGNRLQNQTGGATRVASEVANPRIKSNTGWILLALFLLLGTAGAIAVIILY
ncbi:MAG: protein kinase, partial [Deltaproteobacteria bacterium]|nr:protein kinase [Deltaproteobacteria bacterium]